MYIIVLITVGFVVVAYIGYSVLDKLWLQRARIRQRVDIMAKSGVQSVSPVLGDGASAAGDRMVFVRTIADKLLMMLLRAGVKLKPSEFAAVVAGSGLILAVVSALLSGNIYSVILAMFVGAALPFVYLKNRQSHRQSAFNKQLPDALSLIGSSIRTGYSFPRAMQMVADEMPSPISEEFTRAINEISVGMTLESALQRMVARVRSYDLELVVTAVIIQQQVGGNLAEVIDNIAATIRDRVRVEGELTVLTAEGRISGVVLALLPFILVGVILMLSPSFLLPLVRDATGRLLVVLGIIFQIIGLVVIKRMLILDY